MGAVARGDFFEMILIQVKGGTALWPTRDDVARLRVVADRYHARAVVLAEWTKGSKPNLFTLDDQPTGDHDGSAWKPPNARQVFGAKQVKP